MASFAGPRRGRTAGSFVAENDLWEMLMRIVAERKRRGVDPRDMLASSPIACRKMSPPAPPPERLRGAEFTQPAATGRACPWPAESTLVTFMKLAASRFLHPLKGRK